MPDPELIDIAISDAINELCNRAHRNAVNKGFWDAYHEIPASPHQTELEKSILGCKIALIHSEVSECLEYLRKLGKKDDHLPQFEGTVVELADAMIRIFDLAGAMKWPLADALLAKMNYNASRPYKHGKAM